MRMNICNTKVKESMVGVGGGKGGANQGDVEGVEGIGEGVGE